MEVIGVGVAIIDVIHEVAAYPEEDSKIRALTSRKCRGGNVANALVVCAQLGGRSRWIGVSTDPEMDSDAAFVHADLAAFGVDSSLAWIEHEGKMPISYILSSRATGSRTIVHSRNLCELSFETFKKQLAVYRERVHVQQNANSSTWFHFEGRNLNATEKMMRHVRDAMPNAKISVEIEALRNEWGSAMRLISQADYAFVSKDYVRQKLGFDSADQFFAAIEANQWGEAVVGYAKAFICPWGTAGVYYIETPEKRTHHIPAPDIDKIVETIGAGDTFIGASLAGLSRGIAPLDQVLKMACAMASAKCSKQGFELSLEAQSLWHQAWKRVDVNSGTNAA